MTFDDAIAAFAAATALPREAMEWVLDHWEQTGPLCRDLVEGYVSGRDQSERTEQALFVVFHLLGEKADTAIFAPFCRLLRDPERASLVFGEDGLVMSVPSLQISTFGGDPAPLYALSVDPAADVKLRGDALMVLAYFARTRRISESELYHHLAAMPDRAADEDATDLWFGWVSAVGGMGFAGLAAQAEAMFQDGRVDPEAMDPADFWDDLREARETPGQTSGAIWTGFQPLAARSSSSPAGPARMRKATWHGSHPSPNRSATRCATSAATTLAPAAAARSTRSAAWLWPRTDPVLARAPATRQPSRQHRARGPGSPRRQAAARDHGPG